jgi:hypothetical protein
VPSSHPDQLVTARPGLDRSIVGLDVAAVVGGPGRHAVRHRRVAELEPQQVVAAVTCDDVGVAMDREHRHGVVAGAGAAEVDARHGRDGREPFAELAPEGRAHAPRPQDGRSPVPTSTEAVKAVWRGIRKTLGTAVAKKLALEVDDVRGHDAPRGRSEW